ncbi:MAG: WGR domain-containing protein, partial [Polyangiales bacterium]
MPRYELSEGTSNKFWEIELEGSSFTTRYGRIGTEGQVTTKSFATPVEAKKAYEKIVAEKVKKGYELASDGDEEEDDSEESFDEASNPELEAKIVADPNDTQAYLVFADWLQSKGDPRGELIAVQHALSVTPASAPLRA